APAGCARRRRRPRCPGRAARAHGADPPRSRRKRGRHAPPAPRRTVLCDRPLCVRACAPQAVPGGPGPFAEPLAAERARPLAFGITPCCAPAAMAAGSDLAAEEATVGRSVAGDARGPTALGFDVAAACLANAVPFAATGENVGCARCERLDVSR